MVYEARGDNKQAADYYRKVIDFVRDRPDQYEPSFEDTFHRLIQKLDPAPADSAPFTTSVNLREGSHPAHLLPVSVTSTRLPFASRGPGQRSPLSYVPGRPDARGRGRASDFCARAIRARR